MFRKVLKYGLVIGTGTGVAWSIQTSEDGINSIGAVRLTRSVMTAYQIGRVYKKELYGGKEEGGRRFKKNSEEYLQAKAKAHQIGADLLLKLCLTNKGVYVKVGQHLGALDYLLPEQYVKTMRILHKDAPSNSLEQIYKVIREEFHKDPEEMFDNFEPEPLGTASLAQVHRAQLKDGTQVAVKVQHHFVRDNVQVDLRIMETLITAMSWFFPDFQMQWLVDETKKNIYKELNFLQEGANAEKVAVMFQEYTWLKIPNIFWDYSSPRVLVMQYVEGGLVNDYEYIKKHGIDPYNLCKKLGDLYSHMIFVNGFVHSDPHPGNILVKKEPGDKDVTMYLLDHGLYANLSDKFRYDYSQFWLSIIHRDRPKMKEYAQKLGIRTELYGIFACIVTGRPWETIEKGIQKTKPNIKEKNMLSTSAGQLLNDITDCLQNMDRQTLLVLKTNDLIRSIETSLGTAERMCGFTVMAKCCLISVNNEEYKTANNAFNRLSVQMKRLYILFWYHLYNLLMEIRFRFLL